MTEIPIACTLEPEAMRDRMRLIEALAADALIARAPIAEGVRYTFRAGEDVERRVRELAAAESKCCAFLAFAVGRGEDGALRLDVTGPGAGQSPLM